MLNFEQPEIHTILLDMDDVLVDSTKMFSDILGVSDFDLERHIHVLKAFGEKQRFIFPLIFKAIDQESFSTAPRTNFTNAVTHRLLDYWTNELKINVEILTSTMKENPKREELQQQKLIWLQQNGLGHLKANFAVGSEDKQTYAKKGVLLIDDFDRTIGQFISRGGYGIQYTNLTEVLYKLSLLNLIPPF